MVICRGERLQEETLLTEQCSGAVEETEADESAAMEARGRRQQRAGHGACVGGDR